MVSLLLIYAQIECEIYVRVIRVCSSTLTMRSIISSLQLKLGVSAVNYLLAYRL